MKEERQPNLGPRVDDLEHRGFVLPAGCNIRAVVLRELCGYDRIEAARDMRVDAAGISVGEAIVGESMGRLRRAIVAINRNGEVDEAGDFILEKVEHPFAELDGWNERTLDALNECFATIAEVDRVELKKLVGSSVNWRPGGPMKLSAAAAGAPNTGGAPPRPGSSANGSGSPATSAASPGKSTSGAASAGQAK